MLIKFIKEENEKSREHEIHLCQMLFGSNQHFQSNNSGCSCVNYAGFQQQQTDSPTHSQGRNLPGDLLTLSFILGSRTHFMTQIIKNNGSD